jgi:hypothetical protein
LCSDNEAGGRDGIAEIKLKELNIKKVTEHWGNEIANKVTCSHMWVELCILLLQPAFKGV